MARKRTFEDWSGQGSGATLQACKTRPGRSWYLYIEPRAAAVLRARLRFNRASLAASLSRRALKASPCCPHPPCRAGGVEESVEHGLMHCPMLDDARRRCRLTLNRTLGRPLDLPLTLETLLGTVQPTAKSDTNSPARVTADCAPRCEARPICLAGDVRPAPSPAALSDPARPSRRAASLRIPRAILFITGWFLRQVRRAHGGVL